MGMRVWVSVYHARTRNTHRCTLFTIYLPMGKTFSPNPHPNGLKPTGYAGNGYPFPSVGLRSRGGGDELYAVSLCCGFYCFVGGIRRETYKWELSISPPN